MSFEYKPEMHNFILLFQGKKINEEKLKKDILKRLTKVKNITIRGKLKLESYEPPKPLGEYVIRGGEMIYVPISYDEYYKGCIKMSNIQGVRAELCFYPGKIDQIRITHEQSKGKRFAIYLMPIIDYNTYNFSHPHLQFEIGNNITLFTGNMQIQEFITKRAIIKKVEENEDEALKMGSEIIKSILKDLPSLTEKLFREMLIIHEKE